MGIKRLICLAQAAVLPNWVLLAAATDYETADFLPLAVGNSWTYKHWSNITDPEDDWSTYRAQFPKKPQFTITVEQTEVIDGATYYVISEMPDNWPTPPPHFIAGKKLRWEGTHLMERTPEGEQAIYRFNGTDEVGYKIATPGGYTRVTVKVYADPVPQYSFRFHDKDDPYGTWIQSGAFRAGYGYERGRRIPDHTAFSFLNILTPLKATIGGVFLEKIPAVSSLTSEDEENKPPPLLCDRLSVPTAEMVPGVDFGPGRTIITVNQTKSSISEMLTDAVKQDRTEIGEAAFDSIGSVYGLEAILPVVPHSFLLMFPYDSNLAFIGEAYCGLPYRYSVWGDIYIPAVTTETNLTPMSWGALKLELSKEPTGRRIE